MTADAIRLSVIVASHDARGSVADCVASIERQLTPQDELIVVDNSQDGTGQIVRDRFRRVRLLSLDPSALVNELWSAGIRASHGDIVVLTTAHCIPAPDWIAQVVRAHGAGATGIGGAIDAEDGSGVIDWAVCFCRYSRFLPPLTNQAVTDIPADNAAYARGALLRHEDQWRAGFWEPQVHHALLAEGGQLRLAPEMLVRHRHSFGFAQFIRERYRHGRQYGGWRATTLTPSRRALHIVASPLIAPLLLARTMQRVLQKGGRTGRLIVAAPALAAFFLAWACGEALGYVRGPVR